MLERNQRNGRERPKFKSLLNISVPTLYSAESFSLTTCPRPSG